MGMEKFHMYAQLYESEKRFRRACDQIAFLNDKLHDLQARYTRARDNNNKCFRYNIRMRLLVVEGMVKSYCHYACLKKNEVLDLRFKLYGEDPDDGETVFDDNRTDNEEEEEWNTSPELASGNHGSGDNIRHIIQTLGHHVHVLFLTGGR